MPSVASILLVSILTWLRLRLAMQMELLASCYQLPGCRLQAGYLPTEAPPNGPLTLGLTFPTVAELATGAGGGLRSESSMPFRRTPRRPWQNLYCGRVIGSMRGYTFEHMIVLNEQHLRRGIRSYVTS